MATRPGEENVATLFGDIHYFYSPPEAKPRHHRFDKGSYVYLFENASEKRCRVEIANNPGTDDQDAFDGYLDQTHVRYSYKHHCMVAITVAHSVDHSEWHLPTYDLRNENKYHYKLHSLDVYFWTQQDALAFVNGVRRVLPASQVEVLDEPGPPAQTTAMSAVVQKLESAAITDQQQQQQRHSQQEASSAHSSLQPSHEFAPPPVGTPPTSSEASPVHPAQPQTFAPMAYNPAAPAAPEQLQHREKTPPPDEDPLNPLAVAVAHDYQRQPFTPGFAPQYAQYPQGLASPGLPQSIASPGMTHFAPPPQMPPAPAAPHAQPGSHPGMQRAATMPVYGAMGSPALANPYAGGHPHHPGIHQQQQQQHQPQMPGPPPPPQQSMSPAPPGGYSNYSYGNSGSTQGVSDYSIHQQAYRPTQAEAGGQHVKAEPRGRLEENAGRLEKGVSGMLKKFEKKFG